MALAIAPSIVDHDTIAISWLLLDDKCTPVSPLGKALRQQQEEEEDVIAKQPLLLSPGSQSVFTCEGHGVVCYISHDCV